MQQALESHKQEIMSNRFKFPKPIEVYKALTPFGPHIVASEHEDWKKYRKVTAPAFTEVRLECDSGSHGRFESFVLIRSAEQQTCMERDYPDC